MLVFADVRNKRRNLSVSRLLSDMTTTSIPIAKSRHVFFIDFTRYFVVGSFKVGGLYKDEYSSLQSQTPKHQLGFGPGILHALLS
jgi:hypothetical protein